LDQAAQGSGGVPISGGVQKTHKYGTLVHGLAGMVVLGSRLDLMILEVFSNLKDSVILRWEGHNRGLQVGRGTLGVAWVKQGKLVGMVVTG